MGATGGGLEETLAGYIATNRSRTDLLEIARKLPASAAQNRLLETLKDQEGAAKATKKSTKSAVDSSRKHAADAATVADDAVEKAKRFPEQEVYSDLRSFTLVELLAAIEMLPDKDDTKTLTAIITDRGRLAARYVIIVYGEPPMCALPDKMLQQCRIVHIKPKDRLTAMYPVVLPPSNDEARQRATYEVELPNLDAAV